MRTKNEFRAIRERCGITQAALARQMGVSQRSVRYWEDADSRRTPPDEAWEILDAALSRQREALAYATAKVEETMAVAEGELAAVRLPYWLSEGEYLAASTDAADAVRGDWRQANASNVAMAIVLEARGIAVEWVEGNPARPGVG